MKVETKKLADALTARAAAMGPEFASKFFTMMEELETDCSMELAANEEKELPAHYAEKSNLVLELVSKMGF